MIGERDMRKIYNRIVSSPFAINSFWMLVLKVFSTVLPMVSLPYVTRILSKESYGEFAVALNIVAYMQTAVEYGFTLTGAKKIATKQYKDEHNYLHTTIFLSRIALCTLAGIIALFIIWAKRDSPTICACIMILFMYVISVVFQQNWYYQGIQQMKTIAIINIISSMASFVLIFLFVKKENDVYLYSFLYVINYIISGFAGYVVAKVKFKLKFIRVGFKAVFQELKDGWYLFLSSSFTKVFGGIGITCLGIYCLEGEVASYAAISKIPTVITLTYSAFSQSLYPKMCESFSKSEKDGIRTAIKFGIPITMIFVVPCMLIAMLNRILVYIAFGVQYVNDSRILIPLMIWTVLGLINNLLGIQVLVASGHEKQYSKAFVLSGILMILITICFIRIAGGMGAALAAMTAEGILTILLLYYCYKYIWKKMKETKTRKKT